MTRVIRHVAIVGVGLIGGSFAAALRAAGFDGTITGISSQRSLDAAAALLDRGSTSLDAVADADLLLLAQPIGRIIETIPQLLVYRKPGAIVTDAGSTKRKICAAAAGVPDFIGGHPLAGKAVRGAEAADPDLFRGRTWILTASPPPALAELLELAGARILVMTPEEHDRLVAESSHLPQILSTVLASMVQDARRTGGPGLESMTRLAGSSFEIWRDIFETNSDEILAATERYAALLAQMQEAIRDKEPAAVERFFELGQPYEN